MKQLPSSLDRKINIEEFGVVSKRQFMEKAKQAGWTVQANEMDGYEFGTYKRRTFNRLAGNEQVEYEKRMSEKKMRYSIILPCGFISYSVSKAEFDYFNSLTETDGNQA